MASSSAGEPAVAHLWAKGEVFTFGTLTGPPHPRLGYSNIKKILAYAKNKGKLGFPRISYAVWKHIACNKLQLSEDLAWLYFETYLLVSDCDDADTERRSIGGTDTETVRVDARRFVLFLYIQLLQKISFRTSLVSGDEWPMLQRMRSPDLDTSVGGGGAARGTGPCSRSLDEHAHLTFVSQHLGEMLELLAEVRTGGASTTLLPSSASELLLDVPSVAALGMFIGGSMDKCRTVTELDRIARHPALQAKTGYNKQMDCFNYRALLSWLRGSLGVNPFGVSNCITHGKRLSWLPATTATSDVQAAAAPPPPRGKIGTNDHLVDRACAKGNRLVIATRVCKQTVARASGKLDGAAVKIHRCHGAHFYLLAPLRSVTVEKCRDTTVVLGPVEVAVLLAGCEGVRLVAPCARLVVGASSHCTLYVHTPTRPLLLGGCDGLRLAPYNTHYGALELHARACRLQLDVTGRWDQPLCLAAAAASHGGGGGEPDGGDAAPGAAGRVWDVVPPHEFHPFAVPFEMEGTTTAMPGALPAAYRRATAGRQRLLDAWQKHIHEAALKPAQQKLFQSAVEQRFQDWLAETGHKRELDGLMAYIEARSKKPS